MHAPMLNAHHRLLRHTLLFTMTIKLDLIYIKCNVEKWTQRETETDTEEQEEKRGRERYCDIIAQH